MNANIGGNERVGTNEVLLAAHRLAVGAIRSACGSTPIGLTLAMQDYQAVDGGEAVRDAAPRHIETSLNRSIAESGP